MRALILVAIVSCGSPPAPRTAPVEPAALAPAATAPSPTVPSCADRAAQLGKTMDALTAATPGFMPLARDVVAPTSAQPGHPFDARGEVVLVAKDGTLAMRGGTFATAAEMHAELDARQQAALEGHGSAKFPLYVWADAGAPASTVAALVSLAASLGHYEPRLLVASTRPMPPISTDPTQTAKLPAAEPDSTHYVVAQLKASIGPCGHVLTSLALASSESVEHQAADLSKNIVDGMIQCECKLAQPETFEWAMSVWFGVTAPALAWIEMPVLSKGEKRTIGELVPPRR